MNWLLSFIASFLSRVVKDWRRDNALQDLGAAKQSNAAAAEADRRGKEGDAIDRRLEGSTDSDLDAAMRGDK